MERRLIQHSLIGTGSRIYDQAAARHDRNAGSQLALHDFFDGAGAPAALRAVAKAGINLAHPHFLSGVSKGGANLLLAEHVARTDDHGFCPHYVGYRPPT
jgi:hypothetical protein